jgi:hypothetical protein
MRLSRQAFHRLKPGLPDDISFLYISFLAVGAVLAFRSIQLVKEKC